MRFGSLFSGIEAASAAWEPLGWDTAFVAEVDPFACAHLAHRFPTVPNLGDVSAHDFVERARACGPIEVLVGGSPCQAFSFAGKRQSLSDDRGNLMLRFTEIADELDPDFVCWENVPGVLSTKDNAFGCLLAALAGESSGPLVSSGSKWPNAGHVAGPRRTVAWRVLDAQHCGLAQRRKRVFVVACARARDAGDVLFEYEGERRDSPPRPKKRQAVADTPRASAFGVIDHASYGDELPTLRASGGDCGGGSEALIVQAAAFSAGNSEKARSIGFADEVTPTLRASTSGTNMTPSVVYGIVDSETVSEGTVPTLTARTEGGGNMNAAAYPEVVGTLCASGAGLSRTAGQCNELDFVVAQAVSGIRWIVRRLTPLESERRQGFPDGWTAIPFRKRGIAADTLRYKALGNSMAVPVMQWLGRRIAALVASGKMTSPELYPDRQAAVPKRQVAEPEQPKDNLATWTLEEADPSQLTLIRPPDRRAPSPQSRLGDASFDRGGVTSVGIHNTALRVTEQSGGRVLLC